MWSLLFCWSKTVKKKYRKTQWGTLPSPAHPKIIMWCVTSELSMRGLLPITWKSPSSVHGKIWHLHVVLLEGTLVLSSLKSRYFTSVSKIRYRSSKIISPVAARYAAILSSACRSITLTIIITLFMFSPKFQYR